jgi:hypothetical protein
MEVMEWAVLSRNARKRCANTSTKSYWLVPAIKEGKSNEPDMPCMFPEEKASNIGAFSF